MKPSTSMLNYTVHFSTQMRRFIFVLGIHLTALAISWWNLSRIYPHEAVPILESAGLSLGLGFTSLPLSAGHLLLNLGDQGIISVGGRPLLFLLELLVSFVVFCAFIIFITNGNKWAGWMATLYMFVAAPYWAYYSFALMGI